MEKDPVKDLFFFFIQKFFFGGIRNKDKNKNDQGVGM